MEDTLREPQSEEYERCSSVLILVLMEDTLRVSMDDILYRCT